MTVGGRKGTRRPRFRVKITACWQLRDESSWRGSRQDGHMMGVRVIEQVHHAGGVRIQHFIRGRPAAPCRAAAVQELHCGAALQQLLYSARL